MNHCPERADKHFKDLASAIIALRIAFLHSLAECFREKCVLRRDDKVVRLVTGREKEGKASDGENRTQRLVREKIRERSHCTGPGETADKCKIRSINLSALPLLSFIKADVPN